MTPRESALIRIRAAEGGLQNSTIDRDGALSTNCGVTATLYSDYIGRDATEEDMRAITAALAADVFTWEFDRFHLTDDVLRNHHGLCHHVYDVAVHSGGRRAVMFLQAALGYINHQVKVDGDLGPTSQSELLELSASELEHLVIAFHCVRIKFLGHLITHDKTQAGNADGWFTRLGDLLWLTSGGSNG